jgi:hypothetical protein
VQLAQDGDERIVCRLHGQIVESRAAPLHSRPPRDLGARCAYEQGVQALDGVVALGSRAGQGSKPGA